MSSRPDWVGPSLEIFHQRYLSGDGKPVIVTDALRSWGALTRWSFDLFKAHYGSDNVAPRIFTGSKRMKPMTLSDYLDYLDTPEVMPAGLWLDAATLFPCPAPASPTPPLYLAWNVFGRHPELLEDIALSPKFVEDWLPLLPLELRRTMDEATVFFTSGLMIGPKNSHTRLHYDFLDTHAYLAQIIGRKRCVLFSPEDSAALYAVMSTRMSQTSKSSRFSGRRRRMSASWSRVSCYSSPTAGGTT